MRIQTLGRPGLCALIAFLVPSLDVGCSDANTDDSALTEPQALLSSADNASSSFLLDPIVNLHSGPIRGRVANVAFEFNAIPYAAPPVGTLRWKPPTSVKPWTFPLAAAFPGPPCMG